MQFLSSYRLQLRIEVTSEKNEKWRVILIFLLYNVLQLIQIYNHMQHFFSFLNNSLKKNSHFFLTDKRIGAWGIESSLPGQITRREKLGQSQFLQPFDAAGRQRTWIQYASYIAPCCKTFLVPHPLISHPSIFSYLIL